MSQSGGSRKALAWLTVAELLAMSVWFSATAVSGAIGKAWHLSSGATTWLTATVPLGFVGGALFSATIGLADRVPPRRLISLGAVGAALTTALVAGFPQGGIVPYLLRVMTGAFLSVVYPVAVQWIAEWFPHQRGLAVAILIGGLTLGSAFPHVLTGLPLMRQWSTVLMTSGGLAAFGGLIVWRMIPRSRTWVKPPPFRWNYLHGVIQNRPVMWANVGYWGHMWELYAMWAWLPAFLLASWRGDWSGERLRQVAGVASFIAIGVAGFGGALLGGWAAERWGRTVTTMVAMAVSGTLAIMIGLTYQSNPIGTFVLALVWGASVIADSAQFSAAVTELSSPASRGSALTLQMAVGYLVTVLSIDFVGWAVQKVGWHWAFMALALGPLLGIGGMFRLRRRPESLRMAHGRR
ncbi:MAG: MFS transporter [Sulfobacillus sp.]|nr:MFS transporter [Sulfobacillus sp.]